MSHQDRQPLFNEKALHFGAPRLTDGIVIPVVVATGLRRGDMLRLTMSDLKDDGIHVTPAKTEESSGKSVIYEWAPSVPAMQKAWSMSNFCPMPTSGLPNAFIGARQSVPSL